MATINSRNESNKFIKIVGDDFVHSPSGETEDITYQLFDVSTDKQFNIYSDITCNNLVGNYQILFRANDGVYLKLSQINDTSVSGDVNNTNNLVVGPSEEKKLIEWNDLDSSKVFNTTLK